MTAPDPFMAAEDAVDAVELDEAAAAGSAAAAADSPLARLRRAYVERRREAELFLPVPGWGGDLVARVTIPDHDFARGLTATPGTPDWAADFVAAVVADLHQADGADEDGERHLEPLEGAFGPLRFDARYGETVGLDDVRSPRAAVLSAFTSGGEDSMPALNVVALADFASTVEHWLADTSREIAEAIVPGR